MTEPVLARYAYTAKDAVLAAGTQTLWRLKDGPAWRPLQGMNAIGQVGEKAPTTDQTTLEDTAKRSMAGLYDGPDKELKGKYYGDDVEQQAFISAARANKTVLISHIWPNNVTATYEVVLLGFFMDETKPEEGMAWNIPSKQNGKTTWGTITP